jgi:hypothetical protein
MQLGLLFWEGMVLLLSLVLTVVDPSLILRQRYRKILVVHRSLVILTIYAQATVGVVVLLLFLVVNLVLFLLVMKNQKSLLNF